MKGPQRREQRPPLTHRQIAVGGMIAVLFFAVLFTVVALASHDTGSSGGSVVPDSGPGFEVDVDVDHPRKPAQRSRTPQPRHSPVRLGKNPAPAAPATPRTASTPRAAR